MFVKEKTIRATINGRNEKSVTREESHESEEGLRGPNERGYYAQTRDWASLPARSCSQANKPSQLLCKRGSMQMLLLRAVLPGLMKDGKNGNGFRRGGKERIRSASLRKGSGNTVARLRRLLRGSRGRDRRDLGRSRDRISDRCPHRQHGTLDPLLAVLFRDYAVNWNKRSGEITGEKVKPRIGYRIRFHRQLTIFCRLLCTNEAVLFNFHLIYFFLELLSLKNQCFTQTLSLFESFTRQLRDQTS